MTLYGGAQWVVLLASLISFPILTRLLSTEEYGLFAVANATAALLTGLAKCGLSTAYLREHAALAPAGRTALTATSFWTALGIAVVVAGTYLLVAGGLGLVPGGLPADIPPLIALLVVAAAARDLYYAVVRAEGDFLRVSLVTMLLRLGSVALGLTLCWLLSERILGYLVGAAFWELALIALLWMGVARAGQLPPAAFSPIIVRHLIAYGAPLVVFEVSALTNEYVDRYLIAHFMGLGHVGVYSVGYNLATYVTLGLVMPMWQVLFPAVSRLWEQSGRAQAEDFLSRLLLVYVFVGCGIALLVGANADEVITLFASSKFAQSAHILRIVAMVLLVYGSTWIFGAGFHLQRRTGLLASLMAGAAILNVALNVLLIPKYGLEGAVLATVGSYGVLTVVMVVLSRRYILIAIPVRALVTCGAAGLVAAAVLRLMSFDSELVSIAVKSATGVALYLVPVLTFNPALREMARAGIHRALPGPASVPPS